MSPDEMLERIRIDRRAYQELAEAQTARGSEQYRYSTRVNSIDEWLVNPIWATQQNTPKSRLTMLKRENNKEVETLEKFIKTGGGSRVVYANDSGTLFMIGQDRKPTHILFVMDKTSITANKTRSKHLKPLLEKLAKREKLELNLVTGVPEIPEDCKRIIYIALKHREDADDSELVKLARPRDISESNRFTSCDHCGHCGDPNCEECEHCSYCEPEEEDWDEDEDW